jgi:16S rRNA (guanine527-N7)-methyltransferase
VVALLGDAYATVSRFAEMLAEEGVLRGLIGPREVPRLWERHLLNSAVVAPHLPDSGTVVDVGTGAGLPGVVIAAMRPDLHVVLLEPMERRVAWLNEVVAELGLTSAEVVRGRAEELRGVLRADAITARAVAPMDRLAAWTLPLLGVGGSLVAMKGQHAAAELSSAAGVIRSLGGSAGEVIEAPTLDGLRPTYLVRVVRERVIGTAPVSGGTRPKRARSSGRRS